MVAIAGLPALALLAIRLLGPRAPAVLARAPLASARAARRSAASQPS